MSAAARADEWVEAAFFGEELAPVSPACVLVPRTRRTDAFARTLRQRSAALRAEAARLDAAADEREGF
jgi:hypothetical protein